MKTKSVIIWGLATLIIVIAVAGSVFFTDYQKKQTNLLTLEQERSNSLVMKLHQRDSLVNDYVEALTQIEKDLLLIKEKENLLNVGTVDPEMTKAKKVQISEDIQLVYSLIEQNKKKIADLSRKLRNSGVEIASLNEKVKYLAGVIEERDSSMMVLNQELASRDIQIADLNGQKVELETVVETQKVVIADQVAELNKAYLATGNYKELEERGILAKDGGFLGLGKSKTLKNVETNENFDKIDITTTKTITVNAKKAELITEHPEGSYEWVEENDLVAYMVINDPREFWKVSKYAVLETK